VEVRSERGARIAKERRLPVLRSRAAAKFVGVRTLERTAEDDVRGVQEAVFGSARTGIEGKGEVSGELVLQILLASLAQDGCSGRTGFVSPYGGALDVCAL
jgi:hypothetical protein